MATVVIENAATVPVGTITQYSAMIGSFTKISGPLHTSLGRFLSKTANSVAGGVPVAGFQRFVLFSPSATLLPSYTEVQYAPPVTFVAPVGTITEFSATIGSLSKISGIQHTTLGRFPRSLKFTLAPVLLGRFLRPLNATWVISTPGSTPALQLRGGMIVWVNC